MVTQALDNPVQAQLCYYVIILLCIHLLFNWKIDYWHMYERLQTARDERQHDGVYPFHVGDDEEIKVKVSYGHAHANANINNAVEGKSECPPPAISDSTLYVQASSQLSTAAFGVAASVSGGDRDGDCEVTTEAINEGDRMISNAVEMGFL